MTRRVAFVCAVVGVSAVLLWLAPPALSGRPNSTTPPSNSRGLESRSLTRTSSPLFRFTSSVASAAQTRACVDVEAEGFE